MQELSHTSANMLLVEAPNDRLTPLVELVLVTSEPAYQAEIAGLVKSRRLTEHRIGVSPNGLRQLSEELVRMAAHAEAMAARVGAAARDHDSAESKA